MKNLLVYKYKNTKREYFWRYAVWQSFFDACFAILMLIFAIIGNTTTGFAGHEKGWSLTAIAFFLLFIIFTILAIAIMFLTKRICDDYDEHTITTWVALVFGLPILCFACAKSLKNVKSEMNKPAEEKIEEIKETPDTTTTQVEASA